MAKKQAIYWTDEMDEAIEQAAEAGESKAALARRLGVSAPSITARARDLGIHYNLKSAVSNKPPTPLPGHDHQMRHVQFRDVAEIQMGYQKKSELKVRQPYERLQII